MSDREFAVVVFGATGFTGKLVAEYLGRHAPKGMRWALAGRNEKSLAEVRASVSTSDFPCPPSDVVVASATDDASLARMAARARVVLTTVGPYDAHGEPVVKACVAEGADYVDLTGEPEFVERMIERYGDEAEKKRVRIVHACGFDSIPHDLGALFTVKHLPEGVPLKVEGFVRAKGLASGGTWHSAIGAFAKFREVAKAQKRRSAARAARGPQARRVGGTKSGLHFVKEIGGWACPLPTIDPQIVLRSARSIDRYGPEFRYGHYARVKKLTTVAASAVGIGAVFALAQLPPTRALLLKARKQGEGPPPEVRAKSWFKVTFVGEGGGKRVVTEVSGGDPGYGETSKMISEAALALALDRQALPETFGVITTAVAMGDVLTKRLQKAGIVFRVVEGA